MKLNTRRGTLAGLAVAALAILLTAGACGPDSGQTVENGQQQNATQQLVTNQPIPVSPRSSMRQSLIDVEKAQIAGNQTTSFIFEHANVDPTLTCPSIGTPIAASASLSNPDQISYSLSGGSTGVIAQMDPNGIYTPPATAGTYVQCVNDQGQVETVYSEGDVQAVYGPATWDYTHHKIVLTGPASAKFTGGK